MSNKKFNFNKPILGFDGKPAERESATLGQLLSRVLATESSNDKHEFIKVAGWIKTLWAGDPLSLDKADQEKLKEMIEKNQSLPLWSKAQLYEVMDDGESDEGGHNPFPPVGPKKK